jgi:tetratricopeptide (TPR) repeat protein
MRRLIVLLSLFLVSTLAPAAAQTAIQTALVHHVVSTKVPEAQHAFDEGLTLLYAFNRDESTKRFQKAAQLDPSLAMAWWGVALAQGPNLNYGMTPARITTATDALARAKKLSGGASPVERRYIEALAVRYPAQPGADAEAGYAAYRDKMAQLHADFPADLDAATLYAESVMDVDDYGYNGGASSPARAIVVGTLESVLARDPNHVGANHYHVHAMDYIGVADKAVPSARRLSALPIEPAASHLVHMSGHIYLDVGMFGPLERDNRTAVDDDRAYAASINTTTNRLDYYGHNLDFYLGGALMLDDRIEIERALGFMRSSGSPLGVLAYVRERRWDDVVAWTAPDPRATFNVITWHYARGIAFASRKDARSAHAELSWMDDALAQATGFRARYVNALDRLLGARVAHLDGDDAGAVSRLRSVIADVAPIPPEVFAPWYYPTGEWLGAILLAQGDAAGAEAAFRADLQRTPHNARALYGLMRSLSAQDRSAEARAYASEIAANWRGRIEDLRLDD